MQARAYEIHVGDFLCGGVQHFGTGAIRRIERQRWQWQSNSQYRPKFGASHQSGPDQQWAYQCGAGSAANSQFAHESGRRQVARGSGQLSNAS
jgi:hypothetical protein